MNITDASEFMARRIAREKLCERGKAVQSRASRLAAKLYRAGATVFRAARQAADQVAPSVRRDGAA